MHAGVVAEQVLKFRTLSQVVLDGFVTGQCWSKQNPSKKDSSRGRQASVAYSVVASGPLKGDGKQHVPWLVPMQAVKAHGHAMDTAKPPIPRPAWVQEPACSPRPRSSARCAAGPSARAQVCCRALCKHIMRGVGRAGAKGAALIPVGWACAASQPLWLCRHINCCGAALQPLLVVRVMGKPWGMGLVGYATAFGAVRSIPLGWVKKARACM